jgi:hypothetical protein
MLASYDTYPPTLPPGFSFIEGEEVFDAKRHLQLEAPEHVFSMADFGYTEEERAQFPSPIAAAAPLRVLSDEGIAAMQKTLDLSLAKSTKTSAGDPRFYFGAYQSRFMRDLGASPDLTGFLSDLYRTPVGPYTMAHLGIQVNMSFQPEAVISPWHHDSVSFVMVLSMFDPTKVEGGRFEFFKGTRDEGRQLYRETGEVPAERCEAPLCPPGYAGTIQGSAVFHRGQPLLSEGYRSNIVFSFTARDASYPDGNRTFFTDNHRVSYGVAEGCPDPSYTDWARHNAWLAQARLGTLLEELPWTEHMEFLAEQLRQAVAPVHRAIERLEHGRVGREERNEMYDEDDVIQMSEPRFLPGDARPRATA